MDDWEACYMILQGSTCSPFTTLPNGLSYYRILLDPLKSSSRRVLSGHSTLLRNRGYTSGNPVPERSSRWKRSLKITGGIILNALVVYYLYHLEKMPETGRWRFMNTSLKFEDEFAELSRKKYRAEFEHATLPTTHPLSRHVQHVVSRILSASILGVVRSESSSSDNTVPPPITTLPFIQGKRDGYPSNSSTNNNTLGSTVKWDVIVVNDRRIINALATPGLIVVFTGILPLCRDEEGLAAVLAHEIGHVVARHTAELISSQSPILLFQSLLLQFVRSASDSGGGGGVIPRNGLQIPNSQVHEHEADLIGLRLMSKACYNPQSALNMLSRMAHLESKIPSNRRNFTFTHPSSVDRVKSLEKVIPEGYAIMATNPDCNRVRQQLKEFDGIAHGIGIDGM